MGRLKGLFGEIGRLAGIFKNNAVVAGDGYLAEGSLFLGRMSQLSDGISFLLEATVTWATGPLVLSNILSGTSD